MRVIFQLWKLEFAASYRLILDLYAVHLGCSGRGSFTVTLKCRSIAAVLVKKDEIKELALNQA
jgi:hypothetical protein